MRKHRDRTVVARPAQRGARWGLRPSLSRSRSRATRCRSAGRRRTIAPGFAWTRGHDFGPRLRPSLSRSRPHSVPPTRSRSRTGPDPRSRRTRTAERAHARGRSRPTLLDHSRCALLDRSLDRSGPDSRAALMRMAGCECAIASSGSCTAPAFLVAFLDLSCSPRSPMPRGSLPVGCRRRRGAGRTVMPFSVCEIGVVWAGSRAVGTAQGPLPCPLVYPLAVALAISISPPIGEAWAGRHALVDTQSEAAARLPGALPRHGRRQARRQARRHGGLPCRSRSRERADTQSRSRSRGLNPPSRRLGKKTIYTYILILHM